MAPSLLQVGTVLDPAPSLQKFASCIFIFIEYTTLLDYSTHSLLVHKLHNITSLSYPADRLRYLNCILTAVFLHPNDTEQMDKNNTTLNSLINALREPHVRTKRRKHFSKSVVRHPSTPHFLLIFHNVRKGQQSFEDKFTKTLYEFFPGTIPLFSLAYRKDFQNHFKITDGYFLCIGQGKNKAIVIRERFTCQPKQLCATYLMESFLGEIQGGRNVTWFFNTAFGLAVKNIAGGKEEDSITMKAVRQFVSDGAGVEVSKGKNTYNGPSFGEGYYIDYRDLPTSGMRVYFTGHSSAFRFITSDGVSQSDPSIKIYMKPWRSIVWIAILLFTVILSVLLAYSDLCGRSKRIDNIVGAFLWLFGALIGQSRPESWFYKKRKPYTFKWMPLRMVWLAFAFFLCASYLASWKSEKIVAFPFHIQWKHIREILSSNFTIYLPMKDKDCTSLAKQNLSWSAMNFSSFIQFCSNTPNEQCRFIFGLRQVENYTFTDIKVRVELTCNHKLDYLIRYKLNATRTAVISPVSAFYFFWQLYFDKAMRESRKLKFHHNKESRDDFLSLQNYCFADDVSRYYNIVPRTMTVLFESGIYEKYRRNSSRINDHKWKEYEEKHADLKYGPISLQKSSIGAVFNLFTRCLAVAAVLFFVEASYGSRILLYSNKRTMPVQSPNKIVKVWLSQKPEVGST